MNIKEFSQEFTYAKKKIFFISIYVDVENIVIVLFPSLKIIFIN